MHQIPYSVSRMLCHILIGFVGGTIFIASGKVPAVHSFQDVAHGIISPATTTSVISMPLCEIANQDPIIPAEDKLRQ